MAIADDIRIRQNWGDDGYQFEVLDENSTPDYTYFSETKLFWGRIGDSENPSNQVQMDVEDHWADMVRYCESDVDLYAEMRDYTWAEERIIKNMTECPFPVKDEINSHGCVTGRWSSGTHPPVETQKLERPITATEVALARNKDEKLARLGYGYGMGTKLLARFRDEPPRCYTGKLQNSLAQMLNAQGIPSLIDVADLPDGKLTVEKRHVKD